MTLRRLALALLAAAALLAGCATPQAPAPVGAAQTPWRSLLPTEVLLFGEQHDAPEHHAIETFLVRTLASESRLAAVAMEMAEQGHSTAGLPRDATEVQVREALAWNTAGWPWERYGPTVMAAVRAGVPVAGANLPRSAMREAMATPQWDTHLGTDALADQQARIRSGHCNLLPESQIAPMARIQIARDATMARTVQALLRPGQTVLLIAGGGHVLRGLGVPTHLPGGVSTKVLLAVAGPAEGGDKPPVAQADMVWPTPPLPPQDYCAGMRQR